MRTISTGDILTCTGQQVLVLIEYASDPVSVAMLNSTGTPVPLSSYTENCVVTLPGHPGARYQITFASGAVDVAGVQ